MSEPTRNLEQEYRGKLAEAAGKIVEVDNDECYSFCDKEFEGAYDALKDFVDKSPERKQDKIKSQIGHQRKEKGRSLPIIDEESVDWKEKLGKLTKLCDDLHTHMNRVLGVETESD